MAENSGGISGGGVKYTINVELGGATPSTIAQMANSLSSLQKAAAGDYSGLTKLATALKQIASTGPTGASTTGIDALLKKLTEAAQKIQGLSFGGSTTGYGGAGNVFQAHEQAAKAAISALTSQVNASAQAWANITTSLRNASSSMSGAFGGYAANSAGGGFGGFGGTSYRGYVGSAAQVSAYPRTLTPYYPGHTTPPPPPVVPPPVQGGHGGGQQWGGFSFAASQIDRLNAALIGLGATIGASKIFDFVKEITLLAARVQNLGTVRNVVGGNAGYSEGQLLAYERQTTGMGITTQAARQAEALMAKNQLPVELAPRLARAAQDYAVLMGSNSSEALEHLVTAIVRREPRMLRTVGVTVTPEQAYEKFARQTGRQVTSLSEEEKQRVLLNEVLKQSIMVQGTYESAMRDAYKQYTSLARVIEETKRVLGEAFVPALEVAIRALSGMGSGVSSPGQRIGIATGLGAGIGALGVVGGLGLLKTAGLVGAIHPLLGLGIAGAGAAIGGGIGYWSAQEAERRKRLEDIRVNATEDASRGYDMYAVTKDLKEAMKTFDGTQAAVDKLNAAMERLVNTARAYRIEVNSAGTPQEVLAAVTTQERRSEIPPEEQKALAKKEWESYDLSTSAGRAATYRRRARQLRHHPGNDDGSLDAESRKYQAEKYERMAAAPDSKEAMDEAKWGFAGSKHKYGRYWGGMDENGPVTEEEIATRRKADYEGAENAAASASWKEYTEQKVKWSSVYEQASDLSKKLETESKQGWSDSAKDIDLWRNQATALNRGQLDPSLIKQKYAIEKRKRQSEIYKNYLRDWNDGSKNGWTKKDYAERDKKYRQDLQDLDVGLAKQEKDDTDQMMAAQKVGGAGQALAQNIYNKAAKKGWEDRYTGYRASMGDSAEMIHGQFRYAEERDKMLPDIQNAENAIRELNAVIADLASKGKSTAQAERDLATATAIRAIKTEELASADLKFLQGQTRMAFDNYEGRSRKVAQLEEEIAGLEGRPGKAMTGEAIAARRRQAKEQFEQVDDFLSGRKAARMDRSVPGTGQIGTMFKEYQKEMRSARGGQLLELQNTFASEAWDLAQQSGNPAALQAARQATMALAATAHQRNQALQEEDARAAEEQRILDETIAKKKVQLSIEQQMQANALITLGNLERQLELQERIAAAVLIQNGKGAEAQMLLETAARDRTMRQSQLTAMPGVHGGGGAAAGAGAGAARPVGGAVPGAVGGAGFGGGGGAHAGFFGGAFGGNPFDKGVLWRADRGRNEFSWERTARINAIDDATYMANTAAIILDDDNGAEGGKALRRERFERERGRKDLAFNARRRDAAQMAWLRKRAAQLGIPVEQLIQTMSNPAAFGAGENPFGGEGFERNMNEHAVKVDKAANKMAESVNIVVTTVGKVHDSLDEAAKAFDVDARRAQAIIGVA